MGSIVLAMLLAAASPAGAPRSGDAGCAAATAYSDARRGFAVLVMRDGKPVCDTRSTPAEAPHELWSGTKSFVGIMAAAAVRDGLLTLDEPVAATITEWADDPVRRKMTIRHLLSMTNGQGGTIGKPPTYAEAVVQKLSAAPGEKFQYGPAPMQVFGEVMRRKLVRAGLDADPYAYLKRRILDPLGIHIAAWRRAADGNALLPQGAAMTAAEWAKFGRFILDGGRHQGRMLVDPAAFAEQFKGSAAHPGYGLTWWLPHASATPDPVTAGSDIGRRAAELPKDLVVAAGAGDQRLYVIPSRHMVIVRQARLDLASFGPNADPATRWSDADFLKLLLD